MSERPLILPEHQDWEIVPLEKACSIISRGTAPAYVGRSEVRAIGQRCVTDGVFNADASRPHDSAKMKGVLEPATGDVLLNSTGTGTIGRSCIFDAQGRFIVDGHVTLLRPNSLADGRWINSLLRHPQGQRFLETFCYSGSTNQVELSRSQLALTQIPRPKLPEQRCIAEVLDTVDEAIRKTQQVIAKLQQMKQGLLHDLLTRGIDDNGELRDPERHPEQFKDSPLGRIPRKWEVLPIGQFAEKVQDGTHFSPQSSSGPFRYITSKNIRFGRLDLSGCGWISEREHRAIYARCDVQLGDVLLTKDGANTGNATLNSLSEEFSLLSSVALIRLDPEEDHASFLLQYLLSAAGQQRIKDQMAGLAITRLTLKKINSFLVPRPPKEEQLSIAESLARQDARQEAETTYAEKLNRIKRGLMDDLLTGHVRVPVPMEAAS